MKTLTETDIVEFFMSHELSTDPVEAERLLLRIKEIVETALVQVWNQP